jgi:hypothetical protein
MQPRILRMKLAYSPHTDDTVAPLGVPASRFNGALSFYSVDHDGVVRGS